MPSLFPDATLKTFPRMRHSFPRARFREALPFCPTPGSDVGHRKWSCEKVEGGFRHIETRWSGGATLAGRKPVELLLELRASVYFSCQKKRCGRWGGGGGGLTPFEECVPSIYSNSSPLWQQRNSLDVIQCLPPSGGLWMEALNLRSLGQTARHLGPPPPFSV